MLNGVNIRDLNGVEASTSQLPLIGYTVFWRLTGIRVSHPDLNQAMKATGFDKYLPDPPTPRVALRRALAEWIKSKQRLARNLQLQQNDEDQEENGGGCRRTLIRVINRAGSEHLVYALVAEEIDFSVLGLIGNAVPKNFSWDDLLKFVPEGEQLVAVTPEYKSRRKHRPVSLVLMLSNDEIVRLRLF